MMDSLPYTRYCAVVREGCHIDCNANVAAGTLVPAATKENLVLHLCKAYSRKPEAGGKFKDDRSVKGLIGGIIFACDIFERPLIIINLAITIKPGLPGPLIYSKACMK